MSGYRSSLLKVAIATILFGSAPAAIRAVQIDSYALGIWRLSLSTIGMTVILAVQRGKGFSAIGGELRRHWKLLLAVGVCFGLHWLTYFQSIKLASASIGAIGFSTTGVQLPLLGWLFGFGRPRITAMLGVALAMAGSWLCLPVQEPGHDGQLVGLLIGILSGTCYAGLPMLHQRHAHLDNELRTWGMFLFALPVFLAAAPAAEWSMTARDAWLVFHLGVVVTLIGHYLWVQVSTDLPLQLTSVLGYLQLPASLLLNYVLIGEEMTLAMVAGGACIVGGNLLALSGPLRSPAVRAADTPEERAALTEELPGDAALPLAIELEASDASRHATESS
ncbi:MAG: EamA family transporter [Planctomycetaceae bacterium]|nr:EamA family transporter [Planctomycetaceae bacterium]